VRVERIAQGTNIFRLVLPETRASRLRERLQAAGVVVPPPVRSAQGEMAVQLNVNETWNRADAVTLAAKFEKALAS
jgi:hypothetical protein